MLKFDTTLVVLFGYPSIDSNRGTVVLLKTWAPRGYFTRTGFFGDTAEKYLMSLQLDRLEGENNRTIKPTQHVVVSCF